MLRSPAVSLRAAPSSASVFFAALGSPRPPAGTTQAKLLGACSVYVNGILVTSGPGHNVPTASQVTRQVDVLPFIRASGDNIIGLAGFFDRSHASAGVVPRIQAVLTIVDAQGSYTAAATGPDWVGWGADAYFRPTGDAGISWYPMPNEDLQRGAFPLGWAAPGPTFAPAAPWPAAVVQPDWTAPLYLEPGPPPTALVRLAPCAVIAVPGRDRQILDYGQEFMGGVNLSFPGAAAGTRVTVTLAEELLPDRSGVLSPARTGNRWASNWTLAGDDALDAGVAHHEFVQFRYAQVDGSPTAFTAQPGGGASAWVVQHPAGGDGRNPYEAACSASLPAADVWGTGVTPGASTPLSAWASSDAGLDAVVNLSAYTIIASSLDVNVDGQTRERDVDVVDALNTALGQYHTFSPGDYSVPERTLLEMYTNDTGAWTQWFDFKSSSVLAAHAHALYTGRLAPVAALWTDDDSAIRSDSDAAYNSLQFQAGLRYWNASGSGMLHFPADGSCGGSWACEPLVDWPTSTRDGYDCSPANSDDTVRTGLGSMALGALAQLAGWLGKPDAAARYASRAAASTAALAALTLRRNGSEAFFVDGAVGKSADHAAVHSTLYAVAAGAADGDAALALQLTTFLARHGVPPSSCMTGRWWVEALLRLGVWAPAAADLALAVLTAPGYPGWLDMIAQGATTTMEAWRPADKGNLDWAHPWCASPAFTVPRGVLGAVPLAPGWARWRLAPQPSSIAAIAAAVPTPVGMLTIAWAASTSSTSAGAAANATVSLTVLAGQSAQVCLPVPGAAAVVAAFAGRLAASDALLVDGVPVAATAWGRLLCTASDLAGPSAHVVSRITTAAAARQCGTMALAAGSGCG